MKTASIASRNPRLSAILSLSLLALAAPACVAGAPGESEPDVPEQAAPSDSADPAPAMPAPKPVPVRPALAPNVTLGAELPEKPAHAHAAPPVSPNIDWQVTLSASATSLWPTQYSTLTATANADVGPTPYYIRIRDSFTHSIIASCGTGATCSIPLTHPVPTGEGFVASIDQGGDWDSVEEVSNEVIVDWKATSLSLSANPTNVVVNGTSTLTATTGEDIGPSPFYTYIFDTTTGTYLMSCGYGKSCSVTVSQAAATTHTYQAFLSLVGSSLPLPGLQTTSATSYVTWEPTGPGAAFWDVSLSSVNGPGFATITATANADVGPTPYFIEIFDENGSRLAICGSGTTCSATVLAPSHAVAFIALSSSTLPVTSVQASSNVIFATNFN